MAKGVGYKPRSRILAPLGEFDIIARYFAPLARAPGALDLRDDAAILSPPTGQDLVIASDAVIEGVHFFTDDPPATIGHKALAVNLSDLAAKGAAPFAYLMSLTLREASPPWLGAFAGGLAALQAQAGIALVGGDTSASRGPIVIAITVLGHVPKGTAVLRRGARAGDSLYVTGTIGDACLGLRLRQDPEQAKPWDLTLEERDFLIARYEKPEPCLALAPVLRQAAHAAIDISDGLIGDLEKLCAVSRVGAVVEARRIPFSAAARKALAREPSLLPELITGGDDYELLTAVPDIAAATFEALAGERGAPVSAIGHVVAEKPEISVVDGQGKALALPRKGFVHFA
jgi:thiamine-monophosphate kinase